MKRKTMSILVAGCMLAMTAACGNDHNTSGDDHNTETTAGTSAATTDGTTSSVGENPTNSTGSTGKSMDNTPGTAPDSSRTNGSTTN